MLQKGMDVRRGRDLPGVGANTHAKSSEGPQISFLCADGPADSLQKYLAAVLAQGHGVSGVCI